MTGDTTDTTDIPPRDDDRAALKAIVDQKMMDAETPGFQAEFDPDEADYAGAFVEDAMSEADALASTEDLADALAPRFIQPVAITSTEFTPVPKLYTSETLRRAIDRRPGESLEDALTRLDGE